MLRLRLHRPRAGAVAEAGEAVVAGEVAVVERVVRPQGRKAQKLPHQSI